MKTLVENFTTQLKEALTIAENAKFTPHEHPFKNVIIAGMGGSGIGGTIVSELVFEEAIIPINVYKNYFLPGYVDENTLFIASSYSGNTEETLKALNLAIAKKAKIICIASGGKILEIAEQNGLNYVALPPKMPPRSCLGYSMVALFFILNKFEVITDSFKSDLQNSIFLLNNEKENIKTEAEEIAKFLFNKTPIIYTPAGKEGLAIRWRQQLNENSKLLCSHHTIPEMNHNELVGWASGNANLAVLILQGDFEYTRIMKRIELSKRIISKYTPNIRDIFTKGETIIEKAFYLIHLGDWVSVYLSEMRNVDPNDIAVIEYLKTSLGEFND